MQAGKFGEQDKKWGGKHAESFIQMTSKGLCDRIFINLKHDKPK